MDEADLLTQIQTAARRVRRLAVVVIVALVVVVASLVALAFVSAPLWKDSLSRFQSPTPGVVTIEPVPIHCDDCDALKRHLGLDYLKARVVSGLSSGTVEFEMISMDKGEVKSRQRVASDCKQASGLLTFSVRPSENDPQLFLDVLSHGGTISSGKTPFPESKDQMIVTDVIKKPVEIKPGEQKIIWFKALSDGKVAAPETTLDERLKPDGTGIALRVSVKP